MHSRHSDQPYLLAVDDESELLMLFKKCLTAKGFKVQTSLNALNFWEIIELKHPDIIFLDIQMDGINGVDLCSQLKQQPSTASIPVVILSAFPEARELAKSRGADGFVSKPYSTAKIISEINRILPKLHLGLS